MNSSSKGAAIRLCAPLLTALACISMSGCYLWQGAHGQLSLMARRRPISREIADPRTPPALRDQLRAVASIRDFASRALHLPDNGSYRSYAEVRRPYVVWNVVAAPEFSVEPRQWCYPIVGCVTYRGYFAEKSAQRYAGELRRRGYDVTVGGVAAYSTLGHFDDPVLSTMMGWNDVELAAIIFHELTHQLLYIRDDTSFNEALATVVEEEGVKRWLHSLGRDAELAEHRLQQTRSVQVVRRLIETRDRLRQIYASGRDRTRERELKAAAFAALKGQLAALREEWGSAPALDGWLSADLNNAQLASVAAYFDCVPGFERELEAAGGDLEAFYARVRRFARLDRGQRGALLCGEHPQ